MITKTHLDRQLEELAHSIFPQSKLLRTWALTGGLSVDISAFEIELPNGQTKKMVRRCWDGSKRDLLRFDTHIKNEFEILQFAQKHGIVAPQPYYFCQSESTLGKPFVVIEFIDGAPNMEPTDLDEIVCQLARQLAAIHQYTGAHPALPSLPQRADTFRAVLTRDPAHLDDSLSELQAHRILEAAWPFPQHNPDVLLHGDFRTPNVLWKDGRIVAVIDWELVSLGDPLYDLAFCRYDMLWNFSRDAMHKFTNAYQSIMNTIDYSNLPYWDLCITACTPAYQLHQWFDDEHELQKFRAALRAFTNQAIQNLPI